MTRITINDDDDDDGDDGGDGDDGDDGDKINLSRAMSKPWLSLL